MKLFLENFLTLVGIPFVAILAIIILLLIGPLLFIWSLNVLFGLSIPFTLKTIVASIVFIALFSK